MQIKPIFLALSLSLLAASFCVGGTAKISDRKEIGIAATNKPVVIYVADFDLDATSIKSEKGMLPAPPRMPGPLGELMPPGPGAPKDPQQLARELVEEMSEALVKRLTKAGMTARRLKPGAPLPTSGWLVRGVFTEVNQGNQLRRAVIGFGWGKTDLQVLVDLADLSQGKPQPFYQLATTADSGKMPGAGSTIILGPAGVAVRIAIAGKDLERNVKQTGSKIADNVAKQAKSLPSQP